MYSVEMRVDIGGKDGIPHTFVVVTEQKLGSSLALAYIYSFDPRPSGQIVRYGVV